MITLHRFPSRQPVILDGPHKRQISRLELIADITGIIAVGMLLAVSFVGMTGAFDDDKPLTMACVSCAGGVGR